MQDGTKYIILLRDSETGEFYKDPDNWVTNPDDATTFETQDCAIERRAQISKAKVEILVRDGGGRIRMGVRLWKGVDNLSDHDGG